MSDESVVTRGNDESPYYFYNYENKKVYLYLNTEYAFLSLPDSLKVISQISKITGNSFRISNFSPTSNINNKYKSKVAAKRFYTTLNLGSKTTDEQYLAMLSEIKNLNKEAIVAPYFKDEYGNKIGLSNFFYVNLKKEGDTDILEEMAKKTGSTIVGQDECMPLWYKLSVTENTELNALDCARIFHESGKFSSAEPQLNG